MKYGKAMVFAGMGFELFAIVLGALLIGPIIDEYYDIKPVGTLVLLLLCVVGWLIHFVHMIKNYIKATNEERID